MNGFILQVLIPVLMLLGDVVMTAVIVQFILSMLISFNVVNFHNQLVSALWTALNAILDPVLNPIRRFMPHTGGLDFSPIVLILLIRMVLILLTYAAGQLA